MTKDQVYTRTLPSVKCFPGTFSVINQFHIVICPWAQKCYLHNKWLKVFHGKNELWIIIKQRDNCSKSMQSIPNQNNIHKDILIYFGWQLVQFPRRLSASADFPRCIFKPKENMAVPYSEIIFQIRYCIVL